VFLVAPTVEATAR